MSSRPDLAATRSLLQQGVNSAKVEDLIGCNKWVKTSDICVLSIPVDRVEFTVRSDASCANANEKKVRVDTLSR